MKQRMIILLSLLMSLTTSQAYDFSVEKSGKVLYFNITSPTTCEITLGDIRYNGEVSIPEKVNISDYEYIVTSIGDRAFELCNLTSVSIPTSVKYIGNSAFYACDLTSISLPNSITTIADKAFSYSELQEIIIPSSVTSIGESAFSCCYYLTSVDIPNSVTYIGKSAFASCVRLTEVSIPSSITSINNSTFYKCSSLTSVVIPNSVTSIGHGAFSDCTELASIYLPNSLSYIGNYAFEKCNLSSITIPEEVTFIGEGVFLYCNSLRSFLGKYASEDNKCLIVDGQLNSFAKYGLTSYAIPNTVIKIGSWVFNCCNELTSVFIPESVTSIGANAFQGCSGLTSVVLPNSITFIGNWAFDCCGGLTSIYSYIETPGNITLGQNPFDWNALNNCVLYVPKGTKSLYQYAYQWKEFKNIQEFSIDSYLDDAEPYFNGYDKECGTITYTRTFNSLSWHGIFLPFDMEYNDWAELGEFAKLNNVHQYDDDDDNILERTSIEFNKVSYGRITANTPYVFKPKTTGKITFKVNDAILYACPVEKEPVWCASTEKVYSIYGTYSFIDNLANGQTYFLSSNNQFVQIENAEQTIDPYRIYMVITDKNYGCSIQKSPMQINIIIDGAESGIEQIERDNLLDGIYYDLFGRRIVKPSSGIYIQKGRKVYVK